MLYTGFDNDINDASYKLSKVALRNTPSKSPKEHKTAEEREALKNEGKVASIINLLDEIDTTIYIISDKLDEQPETFDTSLRGGVIIGRRNKAKKFSSVSKNYLQDELVRREMSPLSPKAPKEQYLELLSPYKKSIMKSYNQSIQKQNDLLKEQERRKFNEALKKQSIKPPRTPERRQPQPVPPSLTRATVENYDNDEPEEMETPIKQLFDDEEENERDERRVPTTGDYNRFVEATNNVNPEVLEYYTNDEEDDDEDDEGDDLEDDVDDDEEDDDEGNNDSGSSGDNGNNGNGGDDRNNNSLSKGDLFKSDLNSNISKLEEQANKLTRLTKGLNKAINYSSSVEVQKLNDSEKTLSASYEGIYEILNDYTLDEKFEKKMDSILDKVYNQLIVIDSAINGYSASNYTGGSFWSGFKQGFGDGFYGTLDAAKKVADVATVVAPLMRGAGYEEDLAYMNSSKKRFY